MEDLMKIRTPWMKGLVAKAVRKFVKDKLGINLDFQPGDITFCVKDGNISGHISGDFCVPVSEVTKTKAMRMLELEDDKR